MRGLIEELGLRGSKKLDADLQDRLGYHLLKRRGYEGFMAGTISRTEFGKRLAQEWASFPVLANTKGAHRSVKRGQSYYAGDGLNKSLTAPETVEAVLDRVKAADNSIAVREEPVIVEKPVVKDPEELDKPLTGSKTIWTYITVIFTAIASIFERLNFIDLDWRVQIFMLAVVVGLAGYGIYPRRRIARVYRELKAEFGGA
ncbi:hypothetical protein [Mesorhizobium sp. WSM2239]|uniref:Uncharacterized protein n=2 Tax=unclassified Mesorhizobium TaxID=325217 RepID=A0AAU8D522_9HYPH